MSEHDPSADGSSMPTRIADRYEVRRLLGEGSFTRVYLAFDPVLEREYAIKVLKAEGLTPKFRERFVREARAVAAIYHPNVCLVYDVGTHEGLPYVVTAVVPNTLANLLRRSEGKIPPQSAVSIGRQLALGLAAAHARGVLHRDLKPSNVLYHDDARREVMISDFGLPRFNDGEHTTRSEVPLVTPEYMAPEQVRGQENEIDPRTDVYSLGVIFYELLTGRVPFSGSTWEVALGHCEVSPVPPSRLRPGLDPQLDVIALKALAKKPADRYPSAKAFADVLAGYRPTQDAHAAPRAAVRPSSPVASAPPPSARARPEPDADFDEKPARLPSSRKKKRKSSWTVVRPTGRPVADDAPRPITDRVHFSATAPAAMRPGNRYALNVWAHLAAQRDEVLARAREAHPSGPVQIHTKGGVRVARGTALTVRVLIPAFPIAAPDDTDTLEWDGDVCNATFPVEVPRDAPPGSHAGTALVYAAGLQIAKLHFDLQVAAADAPPVPLKVRETRHKTAFASYASRDRDAVLARIQGIQKALPDMEIFLDVASLRSGEKWADVLEREVANRDVFYLFWSAHARASEWVEREWRAALRVRGVDYIDPVPLVDPKTVPPPPELALALHFNDWVLAYMRGAAAAANEPHGGFRWTTVLVSVLVAVLILGALALFVLGRNG